GVPHGGGGPRDSGGGVDAGGPVGGFGPGPRRGLTGRRVTIQLHPPRRLPAIRRASDRTGAVQDRRGFRPSDEETASTMPAVAEAISPARRSIARSSRPSTSAFARTLATIRSLSVVLVSSSSRPALTPPGRATPAA